MLRRDRLERAISGLVRRLESILESVREQVADRIRKGQYEAAQEMVSQAQALESFVNTVRQGYEALTARWGEGVPARARRDRGRGAVGARRRGRPPARERGARTVAARARRQRESVAEREKRPARTRVQVRRAVTAGGERLPRGTATPQSAFRVPILKALVDLGGQAPAKEVLSRVYEQMQGVLKPVDLERLPYARNRPRWQTYCRWERNKMLAEGLLRRDAARGMWAVSDRGRQFLKQQA